MRCYKTTAVLLLFFVGIVASSQAQQPKKRLPRIGFILSYGPPSSPLLEAFSSGLHELGYAEGQNILIERRYAEGSLNRMAPFVHEFVDQKVDVIMGINNVVIRAAKEATKTIPIVMISSIDPVAAGYVESFAKPGANITGLAWPLREISAKRIELLKELLPKLSRVGLIWDAKGPGPMVARKAYEKAAHAFKLELHSFEIREPNDDLDHMFRAIKMARAEALIVVANALISELARQIFETATKYRLPSMTEDRLFVDAGGLMSYGVNLSDLYRRSAVYVDKILKGAKPASLPVEESNKFELVINHQIAKQIGVVIPQSLSGKADR